LNLHCLEVLCSGLQASLASHWIAIKALPAKGPLGELIQQMLCICCLHQSSVSPITNYQAIPYRGWFGLKIGVAGTYKNQEKQLELLEAATPQGMQLCSWNFQFQLLTATDFCKTPKAAFGASVRPRKRFSGSYRSQWQWTPAFR